MKTKSIWGQPPTRIYKLIKLGENTLGSDFTTCIVGCSDGKFLFPFSRKGHQITGYDIDKDALFGGGAEFPIFKKNGRISFSGQYKLETFPTEYKTYKGICEKAKLEDNNHLIHIEERNFYANPPSEQFDIVFTSCSFQYTINSSKTLQEKVNILQNIVKPNGYAYLDYMLALDENDYESFPKNKYFRKGEMKSFFDNSWSVISFIENNKPSFEYAHIQHPYHHYHRFGYILAQKKGYTK